MKDYKMIYKTDLNVENMFFWEGSNEIRKMINNELLIFWFKVRKKEKNNQKI